MQLLKLAPRPRFHLSQADRFHISLAQLELYIFRRDREVFQQVAAQAVQVRRHQGLMYGPFLLP